MLLAGSGSGSCAHSGPARVADGVLRLLCGLPLTLSTCVQGSWLCTDIVTFWPQPPTSSAGSSCSMHMGIGPVQEALATSSCQGSSYLMLQWQ